jgi:hypothetical protein
LPGDDASDKAKSRTPSFQALALAPPDERHGVCDKHTQFNSPERPDHPAGVAHYIQVQFERGPNGHAAIILIVAGVESREERNDQKDPEQTASGTLSIGRHHRKF